MRPDDLVPHLTPMQMAEVDRAMIEDYGISLTQMMESAGRNLAHVASASRSSSGSDGHS